MTGKTVRQNTRDLTHAAAYVVALGILFGSIVLAGTAAFSDAPTSPLFDWISAGREHIAPQEQNRINQVVANAREIRAALARPIPRPEPLQPITAKLAFGHLKPGGKGATATAAHAPSVPKLPKAAMDAMAMDVSTSKFGASSAVMPELHKIY